MNWTGPIDGLVEAQIRDQQPRLYPQQQEEYPTTTCSVSCLNVHNSIMKLWHFLSVQSLNLFPTCFRLLSSLNKHHKPESTPRVYKIWTKEKEAWIQGGMSTFFSFLGGSRIVLLFSSWQMRTAKLGERVCNKEKNNKNKKNQVPLASEGQRSLHLSEGWPKF